MMKPTNEIREAFRPATIDRSELSRCLAKAIAYKLCGKHAEACDWARRLVTALQCAEVLK